MNTYLLLSLMLLKGVLNHLTLSLLMILLHVYLRHFYFSSLQMEMTVFYLTFYSCSLNLVSMEEMMSDVAVDADADFHDESWTQCVDQMYLPCLQIA